MKIGITTTLIDAENVIDSFISYHLKIGFDRIYLFFDNPDDPCINRVAGREKVSSIRCNQETREQWKSTNAYQSYSHLSPFIQSEPMTRQILNMELACNLAKKDGIDWLLHIDIDELFYSPHQNVYEHFQELSQHGIYFKRYLNYEAIAENEDIIDYFKEVTLFKKNPESYNIEEKKNHQKLLATKNLFTHYSHGKMAAQVDKIYISGIHEFVFDQDLLGKPLDIPKGEPTDPIILHYACCGFEFFWKKFKTLDNFNENIFGRQLFGIYKSAKEVVSSTNKTDAIIYYRNNFMIDESRKQELMAHNLIQRIDFPSQLLSN